MKKKLIILIILLLLCIASYGYFKFRGNNKNVNHVNNTITKKTNKLSNENINYGVTIDKNTNDITSSIIEKNNNIRFLHITDKNKMIMASEISTSSNVDKKVTVKIFNLSSGKTEKQVDIKIENPQYDFVPLNNGFYVTDVNLMVSDKKVHYHIYDNELNLVRTIDLSDLKNKECTMPKLSNSGTNIAYIDTSDGKGSSIYICDLELKNKQKVYEVEYFTPNKPSTFDAISFVDGDKKIAFIGSLYINKDNSSQAFGTVNINGEGFNYKNHDGIHSIIQISKGETFFADAQIERGKDSSGQVFLENVNLNNVREYILKDKNESQYALISDMGNFIVTRLYVTSKNNEPIYRFRIYDTKNKNIIKEFDTIFKGKDYEKCIIQGISICEASNSIYVAYKIDKETKLYQYKLN